MTPYQKYTIGFIGSCIIAGVLITMDGVLAQALALLSAANAGHSISGMIWKPWEHVKE